MSPAHACRRRTRGPGRGSLALLVLLAGVLVNAPVALAHAQLLNTVPASGATVASEPKEVIFEFDQPVGGTLGAVRVYNPQGQEVDNLDVSHPEGHERWMAVGLRPGLEDGTYTATYRVISADTHIVYGGLVFNLGHAGASPRFTVAGLISRGESGTVTRVAFGVVHGLDYASIALVLGGLTFFVLVWLPGLAAVASAEERWSLAAIAFGVRFRALLAAGVVAGLLVSVLGILLQGATAAGVSLWSSLKAGVIESTLESRFGEVWGARAVDWLLLGLLLLVSWKQLRSPSRPPSWLAGAVGVGGAYLAITPALAGHASVESPVGVFFPSDVVHVLAASVWVGGIACLLLALPSATRRLQGTERVRLLLEALSRFSPLALISVVAIAATGVIQAYIDVRSLHALLHSTYGALILAKTALLLLLICLGWVNRERVMPGLERLVERGVATGAVGILARRTLRLELTSLACVFGLTAALISYTPPVDLAGGPFSIDTTLGAAELEMTVSPARVGLNTIHIYLISAKTGAQYTATKELTVTAELPDKGIGPLPLKANLSGPGHYTLNATVLSPGGAWVIRLVNRISEFEESTRTVRVPIQ